MVFNEDVIRMSDPERTRGLIGVEQGPTAFGLDDKVILQSVLGLGSVLNEDGVAHSVIGDVVLNLQVVNTMDSHSSVEGMVNGVVSHIGVVDSANHMEMNRVAA